MTLPSLPSPPHVELPSQFVIPFATLAMIWAVGNIVLGFMYLLFGLKVFRVMTTITGVLWGAALGVSLGYYIDSITVGIIFGAAALGLATWFYTRWMIALPFGLAAAYVGWTTAHLNGANPLACFFICMSAAVGVGGLILIFYRTAVMALTCLQGAWMVVLGSASAILLARNLPITILQNDLRSGAHLLLASVCMLLLALPAFYYQRLRYMALNENGESADEGASAKEPSSRKKAA